MLEDTNTRGTILLQPGTLLDRAIATTQHALNCGALVTIPTEYQFVEQQGVRFLIRTAANLNRKDEAKQKQDRQTTTTGKDFNPFLPYDENLYVADISDTHVCLLNKYNVVDYHLLLITRAFEEQETLLTFADFTAMWVCLAEFDGLTFYNGGKTAGASQRHKHLQIVPLPLTPADFPQIPLEPLLITANCGTVEVLPSLPFAHAFVQLDPIQTKSPQADATVTLNYYYQMLDAVGLKHNVGLNNIQAGAYNLLVTRQWMLLIPRSQESFESIAVNSLGFAGTMFVRNDRQMQILKEWGPMSVLSQVAISR
jgi:sulfate adenylyltransferase (ADP) / ATP adenylyltransferase